MTKPDFEALRAKRDAAVMETLDKIAKDYGCDPSELKHNYNSAKCYCACSTGGPCEHTWDGESYETDSCCSVTCSRCGTSAMSHDLRNAP